MPRAGARRRVAPGAGGVVMPCAIGMVCALAMACGATTAGRATGAADRSVGPASARADAGRDRASAAWRYEVALEPGARGMAVRMCFDGPAPAALRTIVDEAGGGWDGLSVDGPVPRPLTLAGGRVELGALPPDACVRWHVDLADVAAGAGSRSATVLGDSVLLKQSLWLLWPTDASSDVTPTVALELPPGVRASVPWTLVDGERDARRSRYRIDATVSRWTGYTAFGALDLDRFERNGAAIEIARLDHPIACDREGVRAWITDAVDGASMLYGHYPREHLQVVVVPVAGGDGAVYFGAAARGGGAGVFLLLDDHADAARLPGGWTTVHELLHHGMPFVKDPWMGEGFVSYYTEVMRTRQGHRSEREGWQELYEAFERGRRGARGRTLAHDSAAMHEQHAYQRVYWGGAAIAFELDVALRLAHPDRDGFDDAMKQLRSCCGDSVFQFDADALLTRLDRWYGEPIFTQTATRQLAVPDFVDTDAMFAQLGITIADGKVVLDDGHPSAAVRRAIMAPREQP